MTKKLPSVIILISITDDCKIVILKLKKTTMEQQEYRAILQEMILEIKSVRVVIAKKINHTVVQLYWNIGKLLFEKQVIEGYGKSVVERLAIDLKAEFPTYGFSSRYLWEMKRFYETYYQADPKLKQAVSVLPWGHTILLMQKVKNEEEALFYATKSSELAWSRNILLNFIKADAYRNSLLMPSQNNFGQTLAEHLQEQADEIVKSRYNLAFLGVAQALKEMELEKKLVEKIRFFMLELGTGFAFIGNQYKVNLNEKEYFIDLLFFQRNLRALVAIELKIGDFKPEYVGKMGFYLSLLDRYVKNADENPSIGIILCANKDTLEVDIALQNANSPIAVADYQLYFPQENIKKWIENEMKNPNV